jgi:hypothetical protein
MSDFLGVIETAIVIIVLYLLITITEKRNELIYRTLSLACDEFSDNIGTKA